MAPKRRMPSERAAQVERAAEGSQPEETPPREKRARVQADSDPSEAGASRATPRRSARNQADAPPQEEQHLSKATGPGDDGDRAEEAEGSEGAGKEPRHSRIKRHKGRWRPLIPTALNASAFAAGKRQTLVPFGAAFPATDGAAAAADRALVAMWGPAAAAPLLNAPPAQLSPAERRQRFGRDLTAFLQALVAEGDAARAAEKSARAKAAPAPAHWAENERRRRRVQRARAALPVDEAEPCGLCPSCRQPWLGQGCRRTAAAKKIGYKAREAAERAVAAAAAAAGESSSEGEEAEESSGDDQTQRRRLKQGKCGKRKPEAAAAAAGEAPEVLTWHGDPPKQGPALRQARQAHTSHVESARLRAEAEAAEEAAAEAAALAAALAAARPPGPARAAPPRDFVPPPPHPHLLRAAATAASLGASLALVGEYDPHGAAAATGGDAAGGDPNGGAGRQCPLCMGWHGTRTTCPLVAEALATAVPAAAAAAAAAACPHCAGAEVPGCKRCGKGELPDALWVPEALPAPWLQRVAPGTADVMAATRRLAGAAAADYARPDVADRLGPGALLAMGLLAEEVAAAGLGCALASAPPPLP